MTLDSRSGCHHCGTVYNLIRLVLFSKKAILRAKTSSHIIIVAKENLMPTTMAPSLSQRMVRTAGLFQGLVAVPVMLILGEAVFEHLYWYYYYIRVYDFM
jgi:hypothetical protein